MAQVVQRIWRSGPRKVRRTAWGFTLQVNGKQERKYDAAWTKDDAQEALAARLLEREVPAPPPAASVVTFTAMTERYLKEKEICRKRTLQQDKDTITRLLAFFGESTPLTAITAPRIAEYRILRSTTISEKTKRTLAPASVNRELSVLRALLKLAADEECGYLEKAPKVKLDKEPQGRLRYLSADEEARLWAECRKAGEYPVIPRRSPDLYPVVVIALNTGLRKSEIMHLEWARIDFSRGVLRVGDDQEQDPTKSRRRREIPMNRQVYDVLTALPRSGSRLFRGSVRKAFDAAVARAGLRNFRFHDLRHSSASGLTMNGRPLKEVQELLRDASITQTERYSHLSPERLRDAVATLEISTTSAQAPEQPAPIAVTTSQN
jgi:integrase